MSEPQPPYGPPPGLGTPGYGPGHQSVDRGPQQTETKAVVALVLAVLTWTPIVPFVGAIVALVLARLARRDILASGGRLTGLGLVKAARILSIVHLVFVVLVVVLVVLLLVLPVSFS